MYKEKLIFTSLAAFAQSMDATTKEDLHCGFSIFVKLVPERYLEQCFNTKLPFEQKILPLLTLKAF